MVPPTTGGAPDTLQFSAIFAPDPARGPVHTAECTARTDRWQGGTKWHPLPLVRGGEEEAPSQPWMGGTGLLATSILPGMGCLVVYICGMDEKWEWIRLKGLAIRRRAHNRARWQCGIALGAWRPAPPPQKCVDCGAPARVHDHRDYRQPFITDPVCLSCNRRRGPALPEV